MTNRQGEFDLHFAQVSAPVRTLAWLGLPWSRDIRHILHEEYTARRSSQLGHIKREVTTPDCPATMPRGPSKSPLSIARFPGELSPATAPASAATIHRWPPTSQPRFQRYTIGRCWPDSSLQVSRASSGI